MTTRSFAWAIMIAPVTDASASTCSSTPSRRSRWSQPSATRAESASETASTRVATTANPSSTMTWATVVDGPCREMSTHWATQSAATQTLATTVTAVPIDGRSRPGTSELARSSPTAATVRMISGRITR